LSFNPIAGLNNNWYLFDNKTYTTNQTTYAGLMCKAVAANDGGSSGFNEQRSGN
jgi:hypothetical protein